MIHPYRPFTRCERLPLPINDYDQINELWGTDGDDSEAT
jgi:hypothetical protein